MDFTREPIIETIITPKEGWKLVIRSTKASGQEEYFVDAVEVVSFGTGLFFRSKERPKAFLVPSSDYEILEVREARMILKNVREDRSIKIGGGKVTAKEPVEKGESVSLEEPQDTSSLESLVEGRLDKKKERRRHQRRRRGKEEVTPVKEPSLESPAEGEQEGASVPLAQPPQSEEESHLTTPSVVTNLLPPPTTLISETIARYKKDNLFQGAFFKDEPVATLAEEERGDQASFDLKEIEEMQHFREEKAPYEEEGSLQTTLHSEEEPKED